MAAGPAAVVHARYAALVHAGRALVVATAVVVAGTACSAAPRTSPADADEAASPASAGATATADDRCRRFRLADGRTADLRVFLVPGLNPAAIDAVGSALAASPGVGTVEVVDLDATVAEFRALYADDAAMLAAVSPAALPLSFRVLATSEEAADAVARAAEPTPGVREVLHARHEGCAPSH